MITSGQKSAPAGSVTQLFTLPPGPCNVTLGCSSGTAYLGPGTAPGTAGSYPMTPGQTLRWDAFQGSSGAVVSCTVPSGTAVLAWWISTAS